MSVIEIDLVQEYVQLRVQHAPRDAWAELKQRYLNVYRQKKPSGDAEQSWKSASGRAFESIILQEFTAQLSGNTRLAATRWNSLPRALKEPLSERLWIRGELQSVTAESEVDITAYEVDANQTPQRIIAVYSCKVSLRERFQQDLYWAERFRGRGIRFCFITLDNDGVLTKASSQGELSSKQARMSIALYDRIYLFCEESEIQHYRRVFRNIDRLIEDLERWREQG